MKVLVTGGAGYIGSHAVVALLAAGYDAVLLDNFSNASRRTLRALRDLANRDVRCIEGDVRDGKLLDRLFASEEVSAVMHFAALKAAGESVADPLPYYANNLAGTLVLLQRMSAHGVRNLVFSSSAAVYGGGREPFDEQSPTAPVNPYGRTKLMAESCIRDLAASEPGWRVSILRYFNAVGAHPSGRLGEDPALPPSNLLPCIGRVAAGERGRLDIFGSDYSTADGTCVRDYLHVADLADAHVLALARPANAPALATYNLGSGRGHSVLDVVAAFERASGRAIPRQFVARRPGDCAVLLADPARARSELGWKAMRGLDRICADYWRWRSQAGTGAPRPG